MSSHVNLARFDLVSLRLLVECAAAGTLSAASQRCHMSLMGASERLQRLEFALGKPLFHRYRHGLELTEAGVVAARMAAGILMSVDQMIEQVSVANVSAPRFGLNPGRRGRRAAAAKGSSGHFALHQARESGRSARPPT